MISGDTSRSGSSGITTSTIQIRHKPCTHLASQKLITTMMIPTVFSHPCSITLHSAELEILTGKGNRNAGMVGFGYFVLFLLVCAFT